MLVTDADGTWDVTEFDGGVTARQLVTPSASWHAAHTAAVEPPAGPDARAKVQAVIAAALSSATYQDYRAALTLNATVNAP